MLDAREIKTARRDHAADPGRGDGRRRLPGDLARCSSRASARTRSSRGAPAPVRDGLGARRGHQRGLRRALQPASARLLRPPHPPRRPGVLRHHPLVHGLPDVLLPHVLVGGATAGAARRLQAVPRVDRRGDRRWSGPARRPTRSPRSGPSAEEFGFADEMDVLRPAVRARPRRRPLRAPDHQPRSTRSSTRSSSRRAWSSRSRRTARPTDGLSAARIEEEVVVTAERAGGDHPLPGRGAARRQPRTRRTRDREDRHGDAVITIDAEGGPQAHRSAEGGCAAGRLAHRAVHRGRVGAGPGRSPHPGARPRHRRGAHHGRRRHRRRRHGCGGRSERGRRRGRPPHRGSAGRSCGEPSS